MASAQTSGHLCGHRQVCAVGPNGGGNWLPRHDRAAYRRRVGDRPTIYDVARAAGVAASTVSRAYARPGRVNAETAQAIFAAAERIGYRAGRITGSLGRQTGAVGLVARAAGVAASTVSRAYARPGRVNSETARLHLRGGRAHRLPGQPDHRTARPADRGGRVHGLRHHEPVLQGDHQRREEAARLGRLRAAAVRHLGVRPDRTRHVERTLDLVEGVVLSSSRMSDSAIRMIAKQKPLVLLNRKIPETSCIIIDNARGVRRAVEHLAELGHETITYVAGPQASWTEGIRWRALREASTSWSCGCAGSTRTAPRPCAPVSTWRAASPTTAPPRCSPTTTRWRSA